MQLTQRGCKRKWLRFAKGQHRGFTVHPESTYAAKNCSTNVKIKKLSSYKSKGFVPLFLNDCTISFLDGEHVCAQKATFCLMLSKTF